MPGGKTHPPLVCMPLKQYGLAPHPKHLGPLVCAMPSTLDPFCKKGGSCGVQHWVCQHKAAQAAGCWLPCPPVLSLSALIQNCCFPTPASRCITPDTVVFAANPSCAKSVTVVFLRDVPPKRKPHTRYWKKIHLGHPQVPQTRLPPCPHSSGSWCSGLCSVAVPALLGTSHPHTHLCVSCTPTCLFLPGPACHNRAQAGASLPLAPMRWRWLCHPGVADTHEGTHHKRCEHCGWLQARRRGQPEERRDIAFFLSHLKCSRLESERKTFSLFLSQGCVSLVLTHFRALPGKDPKGNWEVWEQPLSCFIYVFLPSPSCSFPVLQPVRGKCPTVTTTHNCVSPGDQACLTEGRSSGKSL